MCKGTLIYVGGFELPDKNAAAHRVISNGKILRDLGFNIVFIDVDKTLQYNSKILNTYKNVQGFDCWSIPYPSKYSEWTRYLTNINYLDSMRDKYKDIKGIIAYNYPALALNNLRKYSIKNDIKIIADCTEWYSTKGTNIIFKVIKGLDSFYRMRFVQKKLNGLIVISKYLEKYYSNCQNVVRIPPLVDIYEDKWDLNIRKDKEQSVPNNIIQLVYSGSPGNNKDKMVNIIDSLYEIKENANYQLKIVGLSRNQFIKDHPNHHEKIKNLDNKVKFVGRVSHEDSLKELKNADYSIFIRDKTRLTMAGFPTKLVESITCATPVITNDSSDIKNYFSDDTYGLLLNNSSVKTLKEAFSKEVLIDYRQREKSNNLNNEIFHYGQYTDSIRKMFSIIMK